LTDRGHRWTFILLDNNPRRDDFWLRLDPPALFLRQGMNPRNRNYALTLPTILPLPEGEGRGEGACLGLVESCCLGTPPRSKGFRPRISFVIWLSSFVILSSAHASSQQTYLTCLTNFETYAETIWHDATGSTHPTNAGYWGDGGSSGNGGIRGMCGVAVAYAVMVKALPGDPKNSNRISHITKALNFAGQAHVTGTKTCTDNSPWGWSSSTSTDWQTPEWSGSMVLACALMQSNLPLQTILDCQRVAGSEASHRSGIAPASGYVSDTKAEENSWDSNILGASAAWMNTNASSSTWLTAAKQYLANGYTMANTNGDSLSSWITTETLYPSWGLENHGFFHPTYEMVAGMSLGDTYLMARISNPTVATQIQAFAEHNVMNVWSNCVSAMVMDSGDFAYPAGLDWELHDYEQNSYITFLAVHFNDPLARWNDDKLAQLVRARQIVNGDGEFVGPSGGGFYREAVEARRTAIAWLHWANADYPSGPTNAPVPVFKHLPDVDIITQRGTNGFVSICYGPQTNGSSQRIMAVIEPPMPSGNTTGFVATPLLPGVIGLGALGNPTGARLVSVSSNVNGFDAELQITNGANGTTEVYVKDTGDSVAIVEVPWPVVSVSATPVGNFSMGIENDPLIGGTRLLEWTGGSALITNRTGVSRTITNTWVCVSGRYGVAAGPAGYFNYQAASSYNRLGAAQDTLQFLSSSNVGPRYAVWFPGRTAAQTASGASQISWSSTSSNATLTFPGLGGSPTLINVTLPATLPIYTPYLLSISNITGSSYQPSYPPTNAVNRNYSDFWVSYGTNAGQGPTVANPEWLQVTFPRTSAISEFQVFPRTANGGYGPKAVQMIFNGSVVYQGTMAATSTLDIKFPQPTNASTAKLLITSSYDPNFPTNSRNVQVMEMTFFERAQPGTFGDWMLHNFTDAQLADSTIGGASADPDQDGVPNLVEFAMGGNPWSADSSAAKLQPVGSTPGTFRFRFQERKNLGDVQRSFESSTDLINWSLATPTTLSNVADLGTLWLREATFPIQAFSTLFRLKFTQ
jgi:hypothetical protein